MPVAIARSIFTALPTACLLAAIALAPTAAQTPSPSSPISPSPSISPSASPPSPSPPITPSPSASPPSPSPPSPSPPSNLQTQLKDAWEKNELVWTLAGLTIVLFGSGYLGVWWLKPKWLLNLPSSDLAVPWTSWKIPVSLVKPLKYRNRALDAWVAQHWQVAQAEFGNLKTVSDRRIHLPLPVCLGQPPQQTFIDTLSGSHLTPCFQKKTALLLIVGEGGAGKTSLACQIAQWGLTKELAPHRLLPVLIETELDDKRSLLAEIQGKLVRLTNQILIDPELVKHLLLRQRILVIVDHLSEMGEATRKEITPALEDFPAKALVITTRLEDSFTDIPNRTLLKPLWIEGSRLSQFMDAYLDSRGKRHLFEDEDYFDACRRLSGMVGQRSITVLLARLYADQMIQQQEGAGGTLPNSIPELMLSYLNQLNRSIEAVNQRDNLQVQQDAQAIAWECLKQTYRPKEASKAAALGALAASSEKSDKLDAKTDAQQRLTYLETRLRLLQTLEPGDKLRIVLDPLAEYLAALWFVERQCQQTDAADPDAIWHQFFAEIDGFLARTNDDPAAIQGFLLAVHDCCKLKQEADQNSIPATVPDALIRKAAARALGSIGTGTERLLALLHDPSDDPTIRRSAAEALGQQGAAADQLCQMLNDDNQPLTLRQGAAVAMRAMPSLKVPLKKGDLGGSTPDSSSEGSPLTPLAKGGTEPMTVPMLIVTLHEGQVTTQVKPIPLWQQPLGDSLTLDLVSIPAGEFLMGSPPDEVGRDWYAANFPETEGKDVEQQHRVTVPAFYLSQTPITQAQWRWVAETLPAIDRDLDPDPANFKGSQRPVESVSWHDAVEFCARLSHHTDQTYRLPSEAEWEYACRGGTTTPFHLGDTLSTELANYDGTYTYGEGSQGVYRQATTPVGSFGVVNAYGLADLHGNVYEWCSDPWHPSYEGAPTDGSTWVDNGDNRYRMVRGGSWCNYPGWCRSAVRLRLTRGNRYHDLGFRVLSSSA